MADATEYLPVVIALAGAYGAYNNNRKMWLGCQTLFYGLISLDAMKDDVNWGIAGGALALTWLSYPSEKKWGRNVPKNAFHKVAGAMILLMGSFAMAANGAADGAAGAGTAGRSRRRRCRCGHPRNTESTGTEDRSAW